MQEKLNLELKKFRSEALANDFENINLKKQNDELKKSNSFVHEPKSNSFVREPKSNSYVQEPKLHSSTFLETQKGTSFCDTKPNISYQTAIPTSIFPDKRVVSRPLSRNASINLDQPASMITLPEFEKKKEVKFNLGDDLPNQSLKQKLSIII